jgi:hypothetical protein
MRKKITGGLSNNKKTTIFQNDLNNISTSSYIRSSNKPPISRKKVYKKWRIPNIHSIQMKSKTRKIKKSHKSIFPTRYSSSNAKTYSVPRNTIYFSNNHNKNIRSVTKNKSHLHNVRSTRRNLQIIKSYKNKSYKQIKSKINFEDKAEEISKVVNEYDDLKNTLIKYNIFVPLI